MGGWGSGRTGGRPTADMSKRIDLAWMIKTKKVEPRHWKSGSLNWTCGGSPAGWISYFANMVDPQNSSLRLTYFRGSGPDREEVVQHVRLEFTELNFGGRRWWMICPCSGHRVAKLYLPNGGDRFASRKAWRLGYRSQRVARRERAFESLSRLQRKLGCAEGYESCIRLAKGMWQRTFDRHLRRYDELEQQYDAEMAYLVLRLGGRC